MKKNFADNLIALLAFVALLLGILLGWQTWNHTRLKIEVAFTEEQTQIFEQMRQQAIEGSPSGAAESLAYVVNYFRPAQSNAKVRVWTRWWSECGVSLFATSFHNFAGKPEKTLERNPKLGLKSMQINTDFPLRLCAFAPLR